MANSDSNTSNRLLLVQQGSVQALADALALLVLELRAAAGVGAASDPGVLDVARLSGLTESGLLAAAIRLQSLLLLAPAGRAAFDMQAAREREGSAPVPPREPEVLLSLWRDGVVQVKAFHAGCAVDSFACTDDALARNLGELLPLLRSRVTL